MNMGRLLRQLRFPHTGRPFDENGLSQVKGQVDRRGDIRAADVSGALEPLAHLVDRFEFPVLIRHDFSFPTRSVSPHLRCRARRCVHPECDEPRDIVLQCTRRFPDPDPLRDRVDGFLQRFRDEVKGNELVLHVHALLSAVEILCCGTCNLPRHVKLHGNGPDALPDVVSDVPVAVLQVPHDFPQLPVQPPEDDSRQQGILNHPERLRELFPGPPAAAEDCGFRNGASLHPDGAVRGRLQVTQWRHFTNGEPGRLPRDEKSRELFPPIPLTRHGKYDKEIGQGAIGKPGLLAVQYVAVRLFHGRRADPLRVAAGPRFGQGNGGRHSACCHRGQDLLFLHPVSGIRDEDLSDDQMDHPGKGKARPSAHADEGLRSRKDICKPCASSPIRCRDAPAQKAAPGHRPPDLPGRFPAPEFAARAQVLARKAHRLPRQSREALFFPAFNRHHSPRIRVARRSARKRISVSS